MKHRIRFLLAAFVSALLPVLAAGQQCGGVERWPVKVGTDSRANQVNLTSPASITVHNLVALPRPQLPPDDDTRLDQETTVYVVQGRLVRFKLESGRTGDQDYHLVVTDDTLHFTPGGSGPASPHSFIAEIVRPDCVPGRHGDPSLVSRFQSQLVSVRAAFEQRFPNITGGWNQAGSIPVTITGVGFFDRPHGQTGRAQNGIEIHPVLDISFDGGGGTPLPTTILQNPGFEDGAQHWAATSGVITNDTSEPARSGGWKAWLGGYGTSHTDTLYQQIAIPATATSATLSLYLHISTEEQTTNQPYDALGVQIRNTNNAVLRTLATYSNLQAQPGFQVRTFDLTAWRGQTVRIYFRATEDNGSMTSFVLDDFQLVTE